LTKGLYGRAITEEDIKSSNELEKIKGAREEATDHHKYIIMKCEMILFLTFYNCYTADEKIIIYIAAALIKYDNFY